MSSRLAPRAIVAVLLLIALSAAGAVALTRGEEEGERAEACPPGYLDEARFETRERREQRGRQAGGETGEAEAKREREREQEREREGEPPVCRAAKGPSRSAS